MFGPLWVDRYPVRLKYTQMENKMSKMEKLVTPVVGVLFLWTFFTFWLV